MKVSFSLCVLSTLIPAVFATPTVRAEAKRADTVAPPATTTVNLGYTVHQGTLNATGDYYLFRNVPYAQQPVGNLRFAQPLLPTGINTTVNDGGSVNLVCNQAWPEWVIAREAAAYGVDAATMAYILDNTVGQTESCLLLDIYVPTAILTAKSAAKADVLLWIHGGGFTSGSKTGSGNPSSLLTESKEDFIFVSINYRLGMFGWLGGSDVKPNLGLYDQRLAIEWTQKYISRFGGGGDLTVMGQSAGAASIVHQMTAYGGVPAPFDQAVILSPAWQFNLNLTAGYEATMAEASIEAGKTIANVAQLKTLSESQLKSVNEAVVAGATYGLFVYGPGVDGTFVPDHPQTLLLNKNLDRTVKVMAQHTSNESVPFTPPTISTAADVRAYAVLSFPESSASTIDTLLNNIYPDVLDGTYPWTTEFSRASKIASEMEFACASRYLSVALDNKSYNSIFSYPPGYHGEDISYVFYNGDVTTLDDGLPVDSAIATDLQKYIATFATKGNPNYPGAVTWPVYGHDANVLEFSSSGPIAKTDDLKNSRCDWIQQAIAQGLF